MYEFSHGGTWFKWSALDRTEKRLAAVSLVAAAFPGMLLGLWLVANGYTITRLFGVPPEKDYPSLWLADWMKNSPGFDAAVALALLATVVSGVAWWRLSLRQDEMFNRVQNYGIGMAGAWGLAFAYLWWMLSLIVPIGPFPLGAFILGELVLMTIFVMRAVRRWG